MAVLDDYETYDALGLAELVKKREVKPDELLDQAVERAEALHPTLNVITVPMYDEARKAIADGLPDGPFTGVPFLVKDLGMDYAGTRTTNGCELFEDYVADHDTELVSRFKQAGLVIFGKSASPEFGLTTSTESRMHGQTRNPWDLDKQAGGSSGGSSAAIASGIVPMAAASDGGGSIRIPASCCGLFGIKPTRGRTPSGPDDGESWSGMSIGHALTRSVRDSAALLDAIAGPELGSPYHAPSQERPYLEETDRDPGKLRIAFQTASFNGVDTKPQCMAAANQARELCEKLGHDVVEAELQLDYMELMDAMRCILSANVRVEIDARLKVLGRDFGDRDVERMTHMLTTGVMENTAVDYVVALNTIHAAGRALARHMVDYDVLLTPMMGTPPVKLGLLSLDKEDMTEFVENVVYTAAFSQLYNASGVPAMSVPLYWDEDGMPNGAQFAGRFGDEATLFRLAAQLERTLPWASRRPARP